MFREMRDRGAIIRTKNSEGKSVWQLPSAQTKQPLQTDMYDQLAADSGESPSS